MLLNEFSSNQTNAHTVIVIVTLVSSEVVEISEVVEMSVVVGPIGAGVVEDGFRTIVQVLTMFGESS